MKLGSCIQLNKSKAQSYHQNVSYFSPTFHGSLTLQIFVGFLRLGHFL